MTGGAPRWTGSIARAALAAVLSSGCGDGPAEPPAGSASALVIAPGALLLAEPGMTQQLRAYTIDADGDSTEVAASFASSDPGIVSVSGAGLATAGSSTGSAQITATSGDLTSAPILVLRAVPAEDAMLIADSQVVGPIAPIDAAAVYAPGWRYRVRLRQAAVQPGQILLATGGAPVGGRVVSATPVAGDVDVVLELIPLNEMFAALSISEQLSLEHAPVSVASAVRSTFSVRRAPGGALRLTPREGRSRLTVSAARPSGNVGRIEQEFDLGPFTCKAEVPQLLTFPLSLDVFSMELDPSLALDLVVEDATLQRMVVEGGIAPRISASPRITAALEAKAECKVQVATLILPIGGPLALIVGGQVPLGVGFEAGAKASFGNLGFDAFLTTSVDAAFGIDCAGGCGVVAEVDQQSPDGYFKPIVPDLGSTLRFELGASAFGWAELTVGNQFLQALQFKAVEMKAGLEQKFELAAPEVQAADPAYASSYSLKPVIEAKAAASLAPLEDLLRISIATLSFAPELPAIAQSPQGTFAITPASVAAGDGTQLGEQATFTITLPAATYLGAYAVEGVQIRWHRTAGAAVVLEPGRPGCTDLEAAQDQLTFTCQTDFLEEHAGAQTFYAFLETRIFGVPVPVPLEVAVDGKATVTVTGGAVSVTPSTVTLLPGQTQTFTASVAGGGSQAVTWSATGGTFTTSGNSLEYTAGSEAGTYSVTATSVASPTHSASAAVTIAEPSGGSATLVNAGGFAQTFVTFPGSTPCTHTDESSEQEAFTASRTFTSQCSGSWTSAPGDAPATLTASASANVSYQLTLAGTTLISVSATGNATASASAQGGPGIIVGGRGEAHSSDTWFDFEVLETVTVSLSGQVSSGAGTTFESPRAFVSLDQSFSGTIFFAEQGTIATTLTLGPGRYTLRGDAFAHANASLPEPTSSSSTASFSITMTVGP
jgi:hypothetical protein